MRLLLVDDEQMTRDSLLKFVDWRAIGICDVATAKNGELALEIIRKNPPQILLCDIRMPKLDGIELARIVHETEPSIKIVFISGYSDKEYLLSAIDLKAEQFIEKPVNIDYLSGVLKKCIADYQLEKNRVEKEKKLESGLAASQPAVLEKIGEEVTKPSFVFSELEKEYGDFFNFGEDSYHVAVIGISAPESFERIRRETLSLLLRDFYALEELKRIAMGLSVSGNLVFVFPASRYEAFRTQLSTVINRLEARLPQSCSYGLALGEKGVEPKAIHCCYKKMEGLAALRFYDGSRHVYNEKSRYATDDFIPLLNPLRRDLMLSLQNKDLQGALHELDEIQSHFEQKRYCDVEAVSDFFENCLLACLDNFTDEASSHLSYKEKEQLIIKLRGRNTLRDKCCFLYNLLSVPLKEVKVNTLKVNEIKRFIIANCINSSLSLDHIAASAELSVSYLCTFFKKNTGQTIVNFLTEVRIAKASQLLAETSLRLSEIAKMAGFYDPNYLSSQFKKIAGCTPTEYREAALIRKAAAEAEKEGVIHYAEKNQGAF